MAEPIDAEATRDMISEELLEVTAKIADLNAQARKLRAIFNTACRSGNVDSESTGAALALLRRAEKAAQRWHDRLIELRQKLSGARHG